jgi:DNA-binding NarL/FixJ family response regulator
MGYTNKEMAPRLRISVKTIAAHRANIMRKMRVTNIAELLRTTIHSGVLAII